MGSADIGNAILAAVRRVRAANAKAVYCCDPVIGDVGRGIFVRPGIPEFMKQQAVPAADIVTPNHFELDYLSGRESRTIPALKDAIRAVQKSGPRVVLVTSVNTQETPADAIDLVAGEGGRFWRVRTPKLGLSVNGAGDAIAALFLVHYLRSGLASQALSEASASVYGLLKRTHEAGSREILLVAAQEEFVKPTHRFSAEEIG
jgi:pyridoxine kinase